MGYCEIDDLKNLLPESQLIRLTDDEGAGAINEYRAQEAIDSGAEEIDVWLGGRYALPITETVPAILSKINVDIAIYNLYSRVKEDIPETRAKRYDNAIKFLDKISMGKISLGLQPPPSPPGEGAYEGGSQVSVRTKVFDEDTMDKY